jgi:ribonuclease BN (tRNA processing enzyme)
MSGLRILPLGVGDAFSARYYSSCFAVESAGTWLLVDCPHPIRKILREAGETAGVPLDVDQFAAVVVTHLHADHSSGLEGLGFFLRFVHNRRLPLLTHPEVARSLWTGHLAAGMEWARQEPDGPYQRRQLDDFFQLHLLDEQKAGTVGPFSIKCRPTQHSIFTTALQIRAGGRCLGYSADTAFDPDLLAWFAPADLIVHETNPGLLHTPYEKLAALPADLRQKMRVTHYPDGFDVNASAIEPLRQGQFCMV